MIVVKLLLQIFCDPINFLITLIVTFSFASQAHVYRIITLSIVWYLHDKSMVDSTDNNNVRQS